MIFHDVEQNSPEWEALRVGKATASNAGKWMANDGKAFGDPAKKYALQVALERITGRKAEFSFKNDETDRGHEQEPVARMLYEEETFSDVSNGGFFCWGEYGDSPDGLIGDHGVLEIKCVLANVHFDTLKRGSFDPTYRWQLISHLDCTQRAWVDFASYCSDFPDGQQLIVHRLHKADYESEINQLRARRDAFLQLVAKHQAEITNQKEAA